MLDGVMYSLMLLAVSTVFVAPTSFIDDHSAGMGPCTCFRPSTAFHLLVTSMHQIVLRQIPHPRIHAAIPSKREMLLK